MGDRRDFGTGRRDLHDDRSLGPVRSALELRLALAVFGFCASVAGLVVSTVVAPHLAWAVLFGVLVAITVANIAVLWLRFAQRRRYRESRDEPDRKAGREV